MTFPAIDNDLFFRVLLFLTAPAWLLLAFAPSWRFTHWLTQSILIPLLLGFTYALLLAKAPALPPRLSLFHIEGVMALLSTPIVTLAFIVNLLALSLFAGAWMVRDAKRRAIPHLAVLPCLLLTCVTGPLGLFVYLLLRLTLRRGGWRLGEDETAANVI